MVSSFVAPTVVYVRNEVIQPVEAQEIQFTSTTTVADYVVRRAKEESVEPSLVYNLVQCESGFVPQQSRVINRYGQREQSYGIWQIHLPAHKNISKETAMDVELSTTWALEQIRAGKVDMWSCHRILYGSRSKLAPQ